MDGPPLSDPGITAGIRDALIGGCAALGGEQATAAWLAGRYPRLGDMIKAILEFHRRAAEWAVTGSAWAPPAAGVVFAAAGFAPPGVPPRGGPLHARAAAADPSARFVYADADLRVYQVNRDLLSGPGRVEVMQARASLPAEVFAEAGEDGPATPARELLDQAVKAGRTLSVHVPLTPGRWPPDLAAAAVAGYAKLLPPGSTMCLSLVVPDPGAASERMLADAAAAAGPAYAHTCQDVARWIREAGMRVHPEGVRPARAWGMPGWADGYRVAPQVPGRPVEAVGIVR